jgi:hypothetical protein
LLEKKNCLLRKHVFEGSPPKEWQNSKTSPQMNPDPTLIGHATIEV